MNQFKITPKRIKRSNGTLLTPNMVVYVTTHSSSPFANGGNEVVAEYMRVWNFDYRKACCNSSDFAWEKVG